MSGIGLSTWPPAKNAELMLAQRRKDVSESVLNLIGSAQLYITECSVLGKTIG
jgi:hypothetical protein